MKVDYAILATLIGEVWTADLARRHLGPHVSTHIESYPDPPLVRYWIYDTAWQLSTYRELQPPDIERLPRVSRSIGDYLDAWVFGAFQLHHFARAHARGGYS